jgi:hypothetical protein
MRNRFNSAGFTLLSSLCALCALCGECSAQLPHARLDRLFPLGGSAGSSVVVTVSGKDLDDLSGLHFDRPGFRAEKVKPNEFRVFVPADAPAGTVEVRTVGRHGISGARLFAVGRGLTEVLEKEPNNTAATAQKVPLDCAVNGTSDGDGDDFFSFPARKGQRVVLDCQALRLDSTLRAVLVLSDSAGKELARSRPYHQRTDPLLDFVAPADGDYVVGLHDGTYAGGQPYRLVISSRPYVESVFPLAMRPGEERTLTVLGRNLPGGKPFTGGTVLDSFLDQVSLGVTAPKEEPANADRFNFLFHPTSSSVKMRGWQFFPKELGNALTPVTLAQADAPVTVEREPNDSADSAQEITLPTVVCGRFDRPGDADWYTFSAKAGEAIRVDLLCERLDLPGDPFVLVTDDKGREIAQFDDHGISYNALALYNRDPFGTFNVPATGKYRLLVQERYGKGGPRYQYVLALGKAVPDFYPVAFHETNPDPTSPLVRKGGSAFLEVCLNRRDFQGPVVVEARDLPPGVSCPPVHVGPGRQFANVVFTADARAKDTEGAFRLEASAVIDGKKVVRHVRAVQRRWAIANISTSRACRQLCLAVRDEAPYGLRLPGTVRCAAGTTIEVPVALRRAGDFHGKVQVVGLNLESGFSLPAVDVPEGKSEATARLSVAGNVAPGSYTIVLRGNAQVPFRRDPKAATKTNVRVADPSTPLTLEVTAARK